MSHMRLWASAAIIAVVILVIFALSVPHTRDVGEKTLAPEAATSVPVVTLRDSFKKGIHTISGSLEAPNACTPVTAVATPVGNEEGILVAITMQTDSGICLQVPTRIRFETTIEAPASLPLTATVNGLPASTTPS